jgi:hypothetical protein
MVTVSLVNNRALSSKIYDVCTCVTRGRSWNLSSQGPDDLQPIFEKLAANRLDRGTLGGSQKKFRKVFPSPSFSGQLLHGIRGILVLEFSISFKRRKP